MRRILLPLDGSDLAHRAVPFAATIAKKTGQTLLLLRAVDPVGSSNDADTELLMQDAVDALNAAAQALSAQGVRVETQVVNDPPDVAILDAAADPDTALIVMSTHGRGGLDRWLHGSVADAVLRESPAPVLVIPSLGAPAWGESPPRIMVTLDGSDRSRAALEPAREFAVALGGTLILASVVPFPQYVAYAEGYSFIEPDPSTVALTEMRAYLEEIAATLRTDTLPVTVSAQFGSAYSGITTMAEDVDATLIVMATHGRGGVARALLGSVATATIRQAGVPVLLVRPDETQTVPQPILSVEPTPAAQPAASAASGAPTSTPTAETPLTVVALSADELALLLRALGQQFHNEPVDPRWAEPARVLLEKLRKARGAPAISGAAMAGRN